jgi:GMP synthase PP-ATPase subunit
MTARAKKMIEGLAELSESELSEVAREFPDLRTVNESSTRRPFRGPDLIKLLGSLRAGPEFADDLEAVIRENQAQELEPSPWEP